MMSIWSLIVSTETNELDLLVEKKAKDRVRNDRVVTEEN